MESDASRKVNKCHLVYRCELITFS